MREPALDRDWIKAKLARHHELGESWVAAHRLFLSFCRNRGSVDRLYFNSLMDGLCGRGHVLRQDMGAGRYVYHYAMAEEREEILEAMPARMARARALRR